MLATAAPVAAQLTVVPTFPVGPAPLVERALNAEVAVATDGSVLFAWTANGPHLSVRRMSAAGLAVRAAEGARQRRLRPRPRRRRERRLRRDFDDGGGGIGGISGRRLDVLGDGIAPAFGVSDVPVGGVSVTLRLATLPSGAVFVWAQNDEFRARLFDGAGAPRGPSFVVDASGRDSLGTVDLGRGNAGRRLRGGVVVLRAVPVGRARVYDANGVPKTPSVSVGTGSVIVGGVAASPLGGFVVSGAGIGAWLGPDGGSRVPLCRRRHRPRDDLARRTDGCRPRPPAGSRSTPPERPLVVWTEYPVIGPNPGCVRNRGHMLAADGTALSFPFLIADAPVEQVRTAALPDGTFVNSWVADGVVVGNVVRPCNASVAVCGDGVTLAECEQCDDGAGNSDTTPDACRTNCALPTCGDGIADLAHGEECDDANGDYCDGCTPLCRGRDRSRLRRRRDRPRLRTGPVRRRESGDRRRLRPSVHAGADPRRRQPPDRLHHAAWTVDNPTNTPLRDKNGEFRNDQACTDNDPRCDFDGGVAGSCLFHVRVCADLTDVDACTPPTRLRSWTLKVPSVAKAAKKPSMAAVRAAFATVPGSIVGPDRRNVCTDWLEVPLPLRQKAAGPSPAKLSLKAIAETYEDAPRFGQADAHLPALKAGVSGKHGLGTPPATVQA